MELVRSSGAQHLAAKIRNKMEHSFFLMDKKAFGALGSSQPSLGSLQENSSGLCLNEKLDLQMSSPRNSSGFGARGCSLS